MADVSSSPAHASALHYECAQSVTNDCDWVVEAIDHASEGECYVTVFSGLSARERAEEYAAWKNAAPVGA